MYSIYIDGSLEGIFLGGEIICKGIHSYCTSFVFFIELSSSPLSVFMTIVLEIGLTHHRFDDRLDDF